MDFARGIFIALILFYELLIYRSKHKHVRIWFSMFSLQILCTNIWRVWNVLYIRFELDKVRKGSRWPWTKLYDGPRKCHYDVPVVLWASRLRVAKSRLDSNIFILCIINVSIIKNVSFRSKKKTCRCNFTVRSYNILRICKILYWLL